MSQNLGHVFLLWFLPFFLIFFSVFAKCAPRLFSLLPVLPLLKKNWDDFQASSVHVEFFCAVTLESPTNAYSGLVIATELSMSSDILPRSHVWVGAHLSPPEYAMRERHVRWGLPKLRLAVHKGREVREGERRCRFILQQVTNNALKVSSKLLTMS